MECEECRKKDVEIASLKERVERMRNEAILKPKDYSSTWIPVAHIPLRSKGA